MKRLWQQRGLILDTLIILGLIMLGVVGLLVLMAVDSVFTRGHRRSVAKELEQAGLSTQPGVGLWRSSKCKM